ncbi:prolipoprotein diacylglyceryl transferase [Thiospirillum jenense]|uniref:Phosphatidylglycerol--prolipoprotein diacylglyceryl transferase n=1 Tax=Thiospirillum jenense TaxID=1653858 RepID=A0A839HHR7_9GAMM|nr:prolipoprotein diacylglyceryl transferase [Thiospirillum jenense]MBB1126696.1 prolipoprotein diacylglyceryl transferase [Thiospirillum jenense]
MLIYPDLDPVALAFGPVQIHWYGLMYLIGFTLAWQLGRYRARRPYSGWTAEMVDDVIFYGIVGTLIGGRLGYMLFYGFEQLVANPLSLIHIWQGGMSFHGGLIGVLIALMLYARRVSMGFFQVTDFIAPLVPVGLFTGRIGNFINGELWGHATNLPWGMQLSCGQFPEYCGNVSLTSEWSLPLHPSQLYQATLEGILLFILLWWFSQRPRPRMAISGLFLLFYGIFRFMVEFVRMPDAHIGYLAFNWLTMGQLLTVPMLVAGAVLLKIAYSRSALK